MLFVKCTIINIKKREGYYMVMRTIEKKDLDISNIPDARIKEFNRSITKGEKPAGKISPLVGMRKVSIQTNRKKNN